MIFRNRSRFLFPSKKKTASVEREVGAEYYDKRFLSDEHWGEHYTQSCYYFIWTVCIDRLRRSNPVRILEIGCGPGQLAAAIHDANVACSYTGIDFSRIAIDLARKACPPHFDFRIEDAVESDVYSTIGYDTLVTTEFLEHINDDLGVLDKVRSGTRIIATVPNFPYVSHVRHFIDSNSVRQRYGSLFGELTVTVIPGVQKNTQFYLMDGTRL
jgi:SAM-dependent methyltransferase